MTPHKYKEAPTDVLFCEICRREFETREKFERGCPHCSPMYNRPRAAVPDVDLAVE